MHTRCQCGERTHTDMHPESPVALYIIAPHFQLLSNKRDERRAGSYSESGVIFMLMPGGHVVRMADRS